MALFPGVGKPGEYKSASLASASAVSITTNTAKTPTGCSLTLEPGEWDITGVVDFQFTDTTSYTALWAGVGTSVDTLGAVDTYATRATAANVPTSAVDIAVVLPEVRVGVTVTTTYYLVAKATFTASTMKAYGTLRARRIR